MCKRDFENEKADTTGILELLFNENYEQYFIYLDKFERYRKLLKTQNILKKREKTFIYELEDDLKEENEDNEEKAAEPNNRLNEIEILNINFLEDNEFLNNFLKDKLHFVEKIDEEVRKVYEHALVVDCMSVFEFDRHVFYRLSVLVQKIFHQRFDWSDTIIGRDLKFNCFKIKFCNTESSLIRFEVDDIQKTVSILSYIN